MDIVKAFNANDLHTEIVIKGTVDDPLFRASDVGVILDISNIRMSITDFDESEKRAVSSIEPSEPFTRRMLAFLETMHNQQYRTQQRHREQRVQVTRIGAKRVFGTDITREVDFYKNKKNKQNKKNEEKIKIKKLLYFFKFLFRYFR
jgi:hypothetical protein